MSDTQIDYVIAFDTYLSRIRNIHAPIDLYREALEEAISQLQEELEAVKEKTKLQGD